MNELEFERLMRKGEQEASAAAKKTVNTNVGHLAVDGKALPGNLAVNVEMQCHSHDQKFCSLLQPLVLVPEPAPRCAPADRPPMPRWALRDCGASPLW